MSSPRGRCPICRYSARLTKAGMLGAHHPGGGPDCKGTGGPPVPYDPNTCGDCMAYRYATPMLTEACWSVGIEVGKNGDALLWQVLEAYHGNGHREAA